MNLIDPVGIVVTSYYSSLWERESFAPTVIWHMEDISPQYPIESFGEHDPWRKHHRPSKLELNGFDVV